MNIASMKNVVKLYGDVNALNYLNLDVSEGEIFGLLGPNGSGKTTAIHILCGLISANSGEVYVFGKKQHLKNLESRRHIGIVTQDITVFSDLSAKDNLKYFGGLYGLRGRELEQNIKETLAFVKLSEYANKKPGTFSGGMKRRLNIACALVHKPKLLIMDEPTVAIDPQSRNHILESIKEIAKRGTTIIYTSHYMEEVQEICSKIAIMDAGRVIAEGTLDELISRMQLEETIRLEVINTSPNLVKEFEAIGGVKNVTIKNNEYFVVSTSKSGNLNRLLETAHRYGGVKSFTTDKANLEDVFLTLTGKQLRDDKEV